MVHYSTEELETMVNYGSNKHENLLEVLAHLDPNGSSAYSNWEIVNEMARAVINCACGHEIMYINNIQHKVTKATIDIGSKCINKFSKHMKDAQNRRLRVFKNPNNKYCGKCSVKFNDIFV
jgi:hypothetical protein